MDYRAVVLALLATGLCGCTTKGGDPLEVRRISGDTYEVTTHVIGLFSDASTVIAKNDEVATKYCSDSKAGMVILGRQSYGGVAQQDSLTFRCSKTAGTAPSSIK